MEDAGARDRPLGVAIVGCGYIGRQRALLTRQHPGIGFLALCDINAGRAERLAGVAAADTWSTEISEIVQRDDVDAVFVTTTEGSHYEPALAAIEAGKDVMVEKPFTFDVADGQHLVDLGRERDLQVYTGFTQRFRRRFASAREQVRNGYLGHITTATARIYLTRTVGHAVISRSPRTTPAVNTLTYSIDLLLWYLDGARVESVVALGGRGQIHDEFGTPDSTWGLLKFDSGTVANVGVSWELPEFHPAYVASMEVELFGREGVLSVQDDHRDVLLVSEHEFPAAYGRKINVAFPNSGMPGEWVMGGFIGAMKDETVAFLESVRSGQRSALLATGQQGVDVQEVALALDRSLETGEFVSLPRRAASTSSVTAD